MNIYLWNVQQFPHPLSWEFHHDVLHEKENNFLNFLNIQNNMCHQRECSHDVDPRKYKSRLMSQKTSFSHIQNQFLPLDNIVQRLCFPQKPISFRDNQEWWMNFVSKGWMYNYLENHLFIWGWSFRDDKFRNNGEAYLYINNWYITCIVFQQR